MGEQQRHRIRPPPSDVDQMDARSADVSREMRQPSQRLLEGRDIEPSPITQELIQPVGLDASLPTRRDQGRQSSRRQPSSQLHQSLGIE